MSGSINRCAAIVAISGTAITDFRATYGGLEIGIAAFLAYCTFPSGMTRVGILSSLCSLIGLAVTRIAGMLLDRGVEKINRILLGAEISGIVLNTVALLR